VQDNLPSGGKHNIEMAKAPQKRTAKLKYFDVDGDLMWIRIRTRSHGPHPAHYFMAPLFGKARDPRPSTRTHTFVLNYNKPEMRLRKCRKSLFGPQNPSPD